MHSITFDTSAKDFILSALDKTVNEDGYIVDAESGKRVPSLDGSYITKDEFAGVIKGSEIYVKSDIVSLIEATDRIRALESA